MNTASLYRTLSLAVLCIAISARSPFVLAQAAEGKAEEAPLLPVFGIDFSPDGQSLAVSGGRSTMNGSVAVWNVADGKLQFDRKEIRGVTHITFSPDGTSLAYVTGEVLAILDTKTWQDIHRFDAEQTRLLFVAYSPDGELLATSAVNGTIKIWKTKTAEEVKSFQAHAKDGYTVAFSPDGKRLLSGGGDHKTKLWDCDTWQELLSFQPSQFVTRRVRWSRDGLFFLTSRFDGYTRIHDGFSGALLAFTEGASDSADLSQDNRLLVTTGWQSEAHIYRMNLDPPTQDEAKQVRELVARFTNDDYQVRESVQQEIAKLGMAAVPILREYADAEDAEVRIRTRISRELMAPKPIATLIGHRGELEVVRLSPDGKRIATGCRGGDIKVWDAATFQEQMSLTLPQTLLTQEPPMP